MALNQISTNSPLSLSSLSGLINGTSQLQNSGTTTSPTQAGLSQFYNSPGYAALYGTQTPSSNPLQNFLNSPAFQLGYGSGPAQQLLSTGSYNPATAFANDPGQQLAIQEGEKELNAQYAAKGLGNSGANAQALSNYMYNQYNNYINGQESLYNNYNTGLTNSMNNYVNQLNSLSQFGSTQTGGSQAQSSAQLAANLLGSLQQSLGTSMSNSYLSTGENISQLLANQGTFGGNAYLNTAAAKSNNIMQGMSLATQIANVINEMAANQLGGQGAMLGTGSAGGY